MNEELHRKLTEQVFAKFYPKLRNLEIEREKQVAILFSGVPGSGKSTIAKQLVTLHGGIRVSLDKILETIDSLHPGLSGDIRQEIAKKTTYKCLDSIAEGNNHLLIIDANIDSLYSQTQEWCGRHGYTTYLIAIDLPRKNIDTRISERYKQNAEFYFKRMDGCLEAQRNFLLVRQPDYTTKIENSFDIPFVYEELGHRNKLHNSTRNHQLTNFLDEQGRATQWPAKRPKQGALLVYLASKFQPDFSYSEREVNEILKQWHTFEDWALLRRELYDKGYFDRKLDGSNYRLGNKH